MALKKKPSPASTRTRVRVLTSFNGMRAGDEADVEMSVRVQGWINVGLVEVVGGQSAAGPGGAEPDDHERVPDGAAGSSEAGSEPGQGFGSGGYGSAASVHPS